MQRARKRMNLFYEKHAVLQLFSLKNLVVVQLLSHV